MKIINSSKKVYDHMYAKLNPQQEEMWVLSLSANKTHIRSSCLFRGTVDCCHVHPRDIIRTVCQDNASSYIICHNHPLQTAKPSAKDIQFTKKLHSISQLMMIPLVDHIILGNDGYFSFADFGILKFTGKKELHFSS